VSDIMIPGVTNSGFDTDGMLEDIMEAERASVTRLEQRVDEYEEERAAWLEIGRRITNLQEASRMLFGFENPFNDRIATSSNERALTANAARNAREGVTAIEIAQLAQADRFVSRSLPDDYRVPAGRYGFRVGEEEEYFNYSGGSLESFAEAVNRRAGDVVNAQVVSDTASTQVLLIEALQTGSANTLSFLEDARSLALSAGILEETLDHTIDAPIQASTVSGWTTAGESVVVQAGTMTVQPGGEASLRFPGTIDTEGALVLALEIDVRNLYTGWTPPPVPPGPEIPGTGSITLDDITIYNEPSDVPLPDWIPPEPPVVTENMELLYLQSGSTIVPLPELEDTEGFVSMQIPLADYVDSVNALNVRNANSHREIRVRNVQIFDPRSRGDVAPVAPLSTAQDAIVVMNGIRVVRTSNTIDDLIDGVTLNLRRATTDEVEVSVEPDIDTVTDALIQFVFYYNELIRQINILTRNEQAIVDEITSFSDEEREEANELLGLLQGDLTLNSLKSRLQTIMMDPYPTSAGSAMVLLGQLGISSNAAGPGGGFDASRLRGYMEMNPAVIDEMLRAHLVPVKELFGNDTDGDQVTDSGVAYEIEQLTTGYIQVGGIISNRSGTLETSIARTEEQIERENERLERVEQQYRIDFAEMESAMNSLEENRRTFENLQTQTGSQ
jgi:flagellar hook-associated protein 2